MYNKIKSNKVYKKSEFDSIKSNNNKFKAKVIKTKIILLIDLKHFLLIQNLQKK